MRKRTLRKIVLSVLGLLVGFQMSGYAQAVDPEENIALNKPAYASSTTNPGAYLPEEAVDGNEVSRWASLHGSHDEWWYVDLEEIYVLNKIEILWEGAYATAFELLTTNTIPTGGQEEAEWEVVISVTESDAPGTGEYTYDVAGKVGRYIKFKGIQAATGYGYSFHEFRVFATEKYVIDNPELTSVIVTPSTIEVKENEEIEFSLSFFDQVGNNYNDVSVEMEIRDAAGEVLADGAEVVEREGNYYIKGNSEGEYTLLVTATDNTTQNKVQSEITPVIVQPARQLHSLSISLPSIYIYEEVFGVVNRGIELSVRGEDQYGENFIPEFEWVVDGEGYVENNVFIPTRIATNKITAKHGDIVSQEIEINVVATGESLALNKTAEGSSENDASQAINGNINAGWVHPHENDGDYEAWIIVDLESVYEQLDLFEIYWEGACAADYVVYYSEDGEDYHKLFEKEDVQSGAGMNQLHQYVIEGVSARYLKVHATKPATVWGINILEIRVYGYVPMIITDEGTHAVITGAWDEEAFIAFDNVDVTSYDLSQVSGLAVKPNTQNPNCLIFVEAGSAISGEDNVITGERAERIVLQDGYSYNNSVKEFNAGEVKYTRDFTNMNGWASLYLPFPADIEDFQVEYFASYNAGESSIYFSEAVMIEANTPYIIKVNQYTGIIDFVSTGTTVLPLSSNTKFATPEGSDFTFKGTFEKIPGEGTLMLKKDGSEFVIGGEGSDIPAFRAYVEANNGSASVKTLSVVHDGQGTTDIADTTLQGDLRVIGGNGSMEIISTVNQTVYVYSIDGRLAGKVNLDAGYNKVNGLAQGAYIVNNQKVIIK